MGFYDPCFITRKQFHIKYVKKTYLRLQRINSIINDVLYAGNQLSNRSRHLIKDISEKCRINSLRLFGAPAFFNLSVTSKLLTEQILHENIQTMAN